MGEYYRPKTVEAAIELAAQHEQAHYIAGGTDLVIALKKRPQDFPCIISLVQIGQLHRITASEQVLRIGALVTHRELQRDALINRYFTALAQGAAAVGSAQVRNIATVGGNLCSGLPSADTASPLLVLGASVRLAGPRGERVVPLDEFFAGPGRTIKERDEVLTEVLVPQPPGRTGSAYLKQAKRKALEIAMIGAAVYLEVDDKGHCRAARIALTTAAPIPMRTRKAEAFLAGQPVTRGILDEAGQIAAGEAAPRTSWRCTREYRKAMVPVLVRRAGLIAMERCNSTL
jgi:carbon-monoxide dehydrogenase medium subunit